MPDCTKRFYDRCSMQRHVKSKHLNQNPTTYKCDQCPKVFRRISQLKCHYITHTGKLHQCKYCPGFMYTPYFRPDNQTQKVFPCNEDNCLKFYYHESNLINHFHTRHTPTYGFECDICGKRFLEKRHVKMHMNRHKGSNAETPNGINKKRNRSAKMPNVEKVILKMEPTEECSDSETSSNPEYIVPTFIKPDPMDADFIDNGSGAAVSPMESHFVKIEPLVETITETQTTSGVNVDESDCETSFVKEELFDIEYNDDK